MSWIDGKDDADLLHSLFYGGRASTGGQRGALNAKKITDRGAQNAEVPPMCSVRGMQNTYTTNPAHWEQDPPKRLTVWQRIKRMVVGDKALND